MFPLANYRPGYDFNDKLEIVDVVRVTSSALRENCVVVPFKHYSDQYTPFKGNVLRNNDYL